MVFAMRLISIFVERVSEVTIFVPSDRTTRSKGVINNANGSLLNIISLRYSMFQPWKLFSKHSRKTFNDQKGNISIGSNSTTDTFFIVLRQAAQSES